MRADELMARARAGRDKAREYMDVLRVRAHLFKSEYRDRQDEVLADLQRRYDRLEFELSTAAGHVEEGAAVTGEAVESAWSAFKERLAETTNVDPERDDHGGN